jgi:Domain of unknown function DUF302
MQYARTVTLELGHEQAVEKVKEALQAQGFGTLTEIDVRATLKEKLGQDMEPYVIPGACNPQLAHRALDVEREIGLLLPATWSCVPPRTPRPSSRHSTSRSWSPCPNARSFSRSPTRLAGASRPRSTRSPGGEMAASHGGNPDRHTPQPTAAPAASSPGGPWALWEGCAAGRL